MINTAGLHRVSAVDQLLVERNDNGDITLLLAKVTDDLLMVGQKEEQEKFTDERSKRFPISKAFIDEPIILNGCNIHQRLDGAIIM